jgi:hypothetical protein
LGGSDPRAVQRAMDRWRPLRSTRSTAARHEQARAWNLPPSSPRGRPGFWPGHVSPLLGSHGDRKSPDPLSPRCRTRAAPRRWRCMSCQHRTPPRTHRSCWASTGTAHAGAQRRRRPARTDRGHHRVRQPAGRPAGRPSYRYRGRARQFASCGESPRPSAGHDHRLARRDASNSAAEPVASGGVGRRPFGEDTFDGGA